MGPNKQASGPIYKLGTTGPWLGPGSYSPSIMDPEDKRLDVLPRLPHGSKYGATSDFLASPPTFFNILYSHPNFGHLSPWAEHSHLMLPPLNSVKGSLVSPSERLKAKCYGHDEVGRQGIRTSLPVWGGLGPGSMATHSIHTFQGRRGATALFTHPASPSMHCPSSAKLPEMPQTRSRTVRAFMPAAYRRLCACRLSFLPWPILGRPRSPRQRILSIGCQRTHSTASKSIRPCTGRHQ